MAGLQWTVGHLQGRIMGLERDHRHIRALLDMCSAQARLLFGDHDESDEDRITLIGLFRLGNILVERLETSIGEVKDIARAGLREQQTAIKGGE